MKKWFCMMVAMCFAALVPLSGCADKETYELTENSYYDSTTHEEDSMDPVYNESLFYRNIKRTSIADPFVLYIDDEHSTENGYYYMYGTTTASFLECFRSRDLINWEAMGVCMNPVDGGSSVQEAVYRSVWAPEVFYDDTLGKYIMFFSASPNNDRGINYLMYAATADAPYGPFEVVDFSSYNRAGSVTLESTGETYSYGSDVFSRYLYFDPAQFTKAVADRLGLPTYQTEGYVSSIDPHPYMDEDGTKYMFATLNGGSNYIFGIPCIDGDWFNLDYSKMKLLIRAGYYEVDGTETNPAEITAGQLTTINEAPTVIKHNGRYYLTLSVNMYSDRSYAVIQAVSDSPLGDYRKLNADEGGVLLSTDGQAMDLVSGPGHCSFVQRDGQMYIIYHKHNSPELGGGSRHVNIDRIEWVSITNKDGEQMDVMYCNGPTTTPQPKPDFASDYVNIADEASLSISGNLKSDSSLDYLTDGLLSIYKYANEGFTEKYIRETVITDTATISLTFGDYRPVRAIMIYNSKWMESSFKEIARVEFDVRTDDGREVTLVIDGLKFDWQFNVNSEDPSLIREASAAIAEFNEMTVKEIRITVEVPTSGWTFDEDGNPIVPEHSYMAFEHDGEVGISEIVVLGKKS